MSSTDTQIKRTIVVNAAIEHAFEVFTQRIDLWWPRTHHIGKVEPFTAILEGREGGRWYERGADGSECEWGRVLVYAPPSRVSVSWHLNASYAYDPDPAKASRVDVTFHDEGGRTRVELVHSELDRHGTDWQKLRAGVDGGWGQILERYGATAAAS
jgi:uncharacterized protein YndB with AHSA1/START domain